MSSWSWTSLWYNFSAWSRSIWKFSMTSWRSSLLIGFPFKLSSAHFWSIWQLTRKIVQCWWTRNNFTSTRVRSCSGWVSNSERHMHTADDWWLPPMMQVDSYISPYIFTRLHFLHVHELDNQQQAEKCVRTKETLFDLWQTSLELDLKFEWHSSSPKVAYKASRTHIRSVKKTKSGMK